MFLSLRHSSRAAWLAVCFAGFSMLAGCGVATSDLARPTSYHGAAITGHVFGGQQPVSGSEIYIFQAASTGYGAAATNLLTTGGLGVYSGGTYGNYTLTDTNGGFDLSGLYTCTAGAPVYILSLGGNPGLAQGTNNTGLALIAALGTCPSGGFSSSLLVVLNEETTVAAAYALSGYMTGAGALSYPTESNNLALTGITNAVANAGQLVDLSSGMALSTTSNGFGIVPATTINTLADIIASCINSNGALTETVGTTTTNTSCGNLYEYTTVNGVAPTDTVGALLNIVHYPASNVAGLYGLVTTSAPFQPTLGTQPNDFTLSIAYSTTLQGVAVTAAAGVPAVDASGNVWFPSQVTASLGSTNYYLSVINGVTPLGAPISNSDIFDESTVSTADITTPLQAAVDSYGNVWAAINSYGAVIRYDPINDAPFMYFYNAGSNDDGHQLAIDGSNYIYISDYTEGQIYKIDRNGTPETFASTPGTNFDIALTNTANAVMGYSSTSGPTPNAFAETTSAGGTVSTPANAALSAPIALPGNASPNTFAADGNGNVWVTDGNNDLFSYPEATVNGAGSNIRKFNGGGLQSNTSAWPVVWLSIDGAGNVWVPNYGSATIPGNLSEFNNSGTPISPATGFVPQSACSAQGAAIDGSGNVWMTCSNSTIPLVEFIGAAVPVATPLTPGSYGVRP